MARRFGYQPGAFRVLCWRFRRQMDRDFFRPSPHGPKSQPRKDAVRSRVIALRKRNFSVYDIRDELDRAGPGRLSVTAIQEVLRAEGFARLPRRADEERPRHPRPLAEAIARTAGEVVAQDPLPCLAGIVVDGLPERVGRDLVGVAVFGHHVHDHRLPQALGAREHLFERRLVVTVHDARVLDAEALENR